MSKDKFQTSPITVTADAITLTPIGPGPAYSDRHIWLPQLFLETIRSGQAAIENREFTGCVLEGPAVILPLNGCFFDGCDMGNAHGDTRNLLLSPQGPRLTGAIPLVNCRFINCSFVGTGFTGSPEFLEQMVKMVQGAPA